MKDLIKAEILKRFGELTPMQQDEVFKYIEFVLWKKKQEFLKKLSSAELIAELDSRQNIKIKR